MPALILLCLLLLTVTVMSLEHARRSKIELFKQRDLLETRVAQRTKQLEDAQTIRLLELQRFAEFGRLSAHLLHEVTNPLTAASLNLQQLGRQQIPALAQARKSLRLMERYVRSARKQLSHESYQTNFCVQKEIKQLMSVLNPLASKAGVHLTISQNQPIKLYGDPARFNQIMANLIANAIDSYSNTEAPGQHRTVQVTIDDTGRYLRVTVRDYGKGITALQIPQIFEPFYTTKNGAVRGLGIGLSIVKQYVRDDYKGTICVNSSRLHGTTFTVLLKIETVINSVKSDDLLLSDLLKATA